MKKKLFTLLSSAVAIAPKSFGTAFDTFNQYALNHFPGQLEDRNHCDIVTRLAIDSDIGFGLAVSDIDDRSAALVDSEYSVPTGIALREVAMENPIGDNGPAVHQQDTEMSVLRVGRVWVDVADGSTAGDPVYVVPVTGALVSSSGGNTLFPNARFKTTVGAGESTLVQLDGNA